jgi:hypothetical protein
MSDEADGVLRVWFVYEIAALAGAFGLLAASLAGYTTVLDGFSRRLRLAGLVFFAIELLIPAYVYLDSRHREDVSGIWLHASAMPVVNLVGLLGYLEERGRTEE